MESALKNALQRIADAKRIAGHEAYGQANVIYNAFRTANDSGIANAKASVDKLKPRYEAGLQLGNLRQTLCLPH